MYSLNYIKKYAIYIMFIKPYNMIKNFLKKIKNFLHPSFSAFENIESGNVKKIPVHKDICIHDFEEYIEYHYVKNGDNLEFELKPVKYYICKNCGFKYYE